MTARDINEMIQQCKVSTNDISDGYHTFGELYEHRTQLFVTICKIISGLKRLKLLSMSLPNDLQVWKSFKHSDGSEISGWFIMGIAKTKGEQITYHLPMSKWEDVDFAEVLDIAPEWDGHTPEDVLKRLKLL